jgi:hypothetical protein
LGTVLLVDHGERLHRKFDTFRNRFFHKTQQVAEHVHKYDINDEEDEAAPIGRPVLERQSAYTN